jgi:MFS family permease
MGAPGLAVAALVIFTVPEPVRGAMEGGAKPDPAHASFWQGLRYLAGVRSVRRLLVAKILLQIGFQGFLVWAPAFFIRVHDMSATKMSALFGLSVGIGGVASQLLAGYSSDWLSRKGEAWRSYWCTLSLFLGLPFMLMVVLGPVNVAIFGMFMISIVTGGATTASITAGLGIVRGSMRGLMTAVLLFCVSIFGMALGPVILGAVSDALKDAHGDMAIRYSLLAVPLAWLLAGVAFWFTGRSTNRDAAIATGEIDEPAPSR